MARLARHKFELVRQGVTNRTERIHRNLEQMVADYDSVIHGYFPAAKPYQEAMDIVWPRIKALIP